MNFKIDLSKEGYRIPGTRSEKFYALIGILNDRRKRHWEALAEFVGKSTRQVRRDVTKISKMYEVKFDEYGRPYISTEDLKSKDRIHQLIDILSSDNLKSIEELSRLFKVSTRTIYRDLSLIEKFFDLEYGFDNKPFIFS